MSGADYPQNGATLAKFGGTIAKFRATNFIISGPYSNESSPFETKTILEPLHQLHDG
jgi:hypothetical protein